MYPLTAHNKERRHANAIAVVETYWRSAVGDCIHDQFKVIAFGRAQSYPNAMTISGDAIEFTVINVVAQELLSVLSGTYTVPSVIGLSTK